MMMMMMSLVICVPQAGAQTSLGIRVFSVGERIPLAIWVKTRSSKSRKLGISPKSLVHGFDKNWQFFHFYILGKIGRENVFHDILGRKKKACADYKNRKYKKSKNWVFPKVHSSGEKLAFFPSFYFW